MDALDTQLIALLRADARASVASLSQHLKVSRVTVTNHIAKLEKEGVIDGYTIRVRPDARIDEVRAWMSLMIDGSDARAIVSSLIGEPCVAALHDTNGRWDLLAELRAANLQHLSEALERIRLLKGIQSSETSIHLATYREPS